MTRPWLTKVWVGRHWRYIHTRRRYQFKTWGPFGVISYKRVRRDELG